MELKKIKALIRSEAAKLGIDAVGFAAPDDATLRTGNLLEFIGNGLHGDMEWLAREPEVRADPRLMMPEIKSIIAVGMNYGPDYDPLEMLKHKDKGNISAYARNRDYHDVLKGRLKQLAAKIMKFAGDEHGDIMRARRRASLEHGHMCESGDEHGDIIKVFVDTAPVMEKPLAALTGIGWCGKHTCLVSREFGSWLFLGIIYTSIEIEPDRTAKDNCGSCRKCLDICPTNAFIDERKIDARRCISYLTIEHKGHIAEEFRRSIGNRIYGCDDCLAVCPWNKFASLARESAFHARPELTAPRIAELLELDDTSFRKLFSASPVKRTGITRFLRNVLIAAGNSGDEALVPAIEKHLASQHVLVRAMAVWALRQLVDNEKFLLARNSHIGLEKDEYVLTEWQRG